MESGQALKPRLPCYLEDCVPLWRPIPIGEARKSLATLLRSSRSQKEWFSLSAKFRVTTYIDEFVSTQPALPWLSSSSAGADHASSCRQRPGTRRSPFRRRGSGGIASNRPDAAAAILPSHQGPSTCTYNVPTFLLSWFVYTFRTPATCFCSKM